MDESRKKEVNNFIKNLNTVAKKPDAPRLYDSCKEFYKNRGVVTETPYSIAEVHKNLYQKELELKENLKKKEDALHKIGKMLGNGTLPILLNKITEYSLHSFYDKETPDWKGVVKTCDKMFIRGAIDGFYDIDEETAKIVYELIKESVLDIMDVLNENSKSKTVVQITDEEKNKVDNIVRSVS